MGEDMEAPAAGEQTLAAKIMAIQRDPSLTDEEKAKKRQELMCGNWKAQAGADNSDGGVLGVHCCSCIVVLGCPLGVMVQACLPMLSKSSAASHAA